VNIHHLELFYYVARHGGINSAVRNIPYGIQQPAVSGQILQLEDDLGVTLFHRRPFALTPAGEDLYGFIRPFFEGLDAMADRIRGGATLPIRVAAASVVLRDHLPIVMTRFRSRYSRAKLTLREGLQRDMEAWLEQREIDLAITLLERKPSPGFKSQGLLTLPLTLLVPRKSRWTSADELWRQDKLAETLISLPPNEGITQHFQAGLAHRGLVWPAGIEVTSLELIEAYVASGFGIGLSVEAPSRPTSPRLRALALPDFDPVVIGVLWRGKLSGPTQALLEELQQRARELNA
jgi:DNA-binding transcriptional LysR family regulator